MMASAQVVETSVNTNNSPSQDYTTNPDDHLNHNIGLHADKHFTIQYKQGEFLTYPICLWHETALRWAKTMC